MHINFIFSLHIDVVKKKDKEILKSQFQTERIDEMFSD